MSTMPDGQIQAAADAKTSTMHHTPVKPMERVVSPEDIERGERMERRRSAEPGFWRFFCRAQRRSYPYGLCHRCI